MIRQTSIEAYNKIKENGLLSKRRWQVYDILFEFGPMTGGELFKAFQSKYSVMAPTNSNVTTRLGELRAFGVVKELGTRVCSVSGQKVILWDVTDQLPIRLKKEKKSKCSHCDGKGYVLEKQTSFF